MGTLEKGKFFFKKKNLKYVKASQILDMNTQIYSAQRSQARSLQYGFSRHIIINLLNQRWGES